MGVLVTVKEVVEPGDDFAIEGTDIAAPDLDYGNLASVGTASPTSPPEESPASAFSRWSPRPQGANGVSE